MSQLKSKHRIHTYTGWRDQIDPHQRSEITRLLFRADHDDAPVLTFHQTLILQLVRILDDGGETQEYIRDIADGE